MGCETTGITAKLVGGTLFFLAVVSLSCGGGHDGRNGFGSDFEVREAVTSALDNDSAIDSSSRELILAAMEGRVSLGQALDELADKTRSLIAGIASVTAPDAPPDAALEQARDGMSEYLRNRIHQVESAISASTPGELQALYTASDPELQAERGNVIQLLVEHDPGLEDYLK